MKRKINAGAIGAKTYTLMERAVADGLAYGWSRAHKHTDSPDVPHIMDCLESAVMLEIGEWFDFGDE